MSTPSTQSYLPSKKFFILIVTLLVLSGIVSLFTATHIYTPHNDISTDEPSPSQEEDIAFSLTDEDNDGLLAWEETLWGTNPNLSDTDGDGIIDGVEIDALRNPLIRGGNDSLEAYPLVPASEENVLSGESSRSSGVAQAFTSSLYQSSLKEGGTTADDLTVINELVANELVQSEIAQPYTKDDIVVTDNTENAIRAYANTYAIQINAYTAIGAPYEIETITEALETGHADAYARIGVFGDFLLRAAESLRARAVPSSYANNHLTIINDFFVMGTALSYVARAQDDAVLALSGFLQYQEILLRSQQTQERLIADIQSTHIIFDTSEPGFIFNYTSE
jgi:hypothetical protein